MAPNLLIVGQGLAGTLLAWELERTGIPFAIADAGHARAATMASAGIINPITGMRLVKSWRVDELLPLARERYRELEKVLGVPLWREMRVHRLFADARERRVFAEKQARGELAPFVEQADDDGCWIRDAARVDLAALLAAARGHWAKKGWFRGEAVDLAEEVKRHALVIDCRGLVAAQDRRFGFVPWEFSKGELLELAVDGLDPDVIIHRRRWVLPVTPNAVWTGSTHAPGVTDPSSTLAARILLEASARELLARPLHVTGWRAGVRVNLPDKRPVVGRHPDLAQIGLVNGLGAKGALWAPMLARQWAEHFSRGTAFDPEIDLQRFAPAR